VSKHSHFPWLDFTRWTVGQFLYPHIKPEMVQFPAIEAKDGQEPTTDSLREEARQADARAETEKPRALTSHDRKAIDKEFWDSM
jgi:hypothetical protein